MDNTRATTTRQPRYESRPCAFCGVDCTTHPDAANPLDPCGDCGRVTCPDHRVDDAAARCVDCAATFYATEGKQVNITIEKQWDGNECESEGANGRIYLSRGRWQWILIVDGEPHSAYDLRREAKHAAAQLKGGK
jgi:hypothetical protein